MNKTEQIRKEVQQGNLDDFLTAKDLLFEEIKDTEGPEIIESMKKERRDWLTEYRALHNNKDPTDLKDFYNRFNVEPPLTPEEEEAKKLQEEEDAKAAKAKTKAKKEKKKKKKGGDEEEKTKVAKIGPSEVVQKFEEFYEDYTGVWENRDETENYQQAYDTEMAKEEVMPNVEEEFKKMVDELIIAEMESRQIRLGVKKKKKKKGKKKKSKKKKGLKLPGYKVVAPFSKPHLLAELI